jgi:hypothetical protein
MKDTLLFSDIDNGGPGKKVLTADWKQKVERRQKPLLYFKQKPKRILKPKRIVELISALIIAAGGLGAARISSRAETRSYDDNKNPTANNSETVSENEDNVILTHEQNIEDHNLKLAVIGLTKQINHTKNNDEKMPILEIIDDILEVLQKKIKMMRIPKLYMR